MLSSSKIAKHIKAFTENYTDWTDEILIAFTTPLSLFNLMMFHTANRVNHILITLLAWAFSLGVALGQKSNRTEFHTEILRLDSLLFQEGFNKCRTDVLSKIVAADFEMYHDESGPTFGRQNFLHGIEENICSLAYKPYRKLISTEIEVLKSNGEAYGILQNGVHEFYAIEEDQEPYLTSTANFSHLWIKTDAGFILNRVISFNHRTPKDNLDELTNCWDSEGFSFESWLKEHKTPAIGIAILKHKKLKQVSVYGELEQGSPAPYNTIFNVASLTKPVVTILTLKLVENGNWDLDEPLHTYWTDPDVFDDPNSKKITTRHVLSHQTGFKNWRSENESRLLEFDFTPGSDFRYSGEGFEYLKRALEAKFHKNLEELADSIIFKPLKMVDSHFYWTKVVDENRFAKWHDEDGVNSYKTYKNNSASAADDLLTTVEDYGRFAAFILNGAGLSHHLFREMISQQNGQDHSVKMGLGWEILPNLYNDEYAILHTGGDAGVNALIMLLPETGEGLVIFTNGDNGKNLYYELIERYLSLGKIIVGKAE